MFLQKMPGLFEQYIKYKRCEKNNSDCKNVDTEPEQQEVIDDYESGKILNTDQYLSSYNDLEDQEKKKLKVRSECILNRIVDIISQNIDKDIEDVPINGATNKIYNYTNTVHSFDYYYINGSIPKVKYVTRHYYYENERYNLNKTNIENLQKQINETKITTEQVTVETKDSHGVNNKVLAIDNADKKIIMRGIEELFKNKNAKHISKDNVKIKIKKKDDGRVMITFEDNKAYTISEKFVTDYFTLLGEKQRYVQKNEYIINQKKRNKDYQTEIYQTEIKKEIKKEINGIINDSLKINIVNTEYCIIAFDNLIRSNAKAPDECNASQPLLRYCELVF